MAGCGQQSAVQIQSAEAARMAVRVEDDSGGSRRRTPAWIDLDGRSRPQDVEAMLASEAERGFRRTVFRTPQVQAA
jgi:hypothetical protein